MGLRYGLLAALTLVLASALLWDRLHPPRTTALFPRDTPAADETVRIVLGGKEPPPPPGPAAPPSLPGPSTPEAGGVPPLAGGTGEVFPSTEERVYTVASGDTLGGIALSTMGTSKKAAELATHNGMKLSAPLRVGMALRIPPAGGTGSTPSSRESGIAPAPPAASRPAAPPPVSPPSESARTHRIGKGETLYAIARRYYGNGARWRTIAEANGLGEGDSLTVGTTLRIP